MQVSKLLNVGYGKVDYTLKKCGVQKRSYAEAKRVLDSSPEGVEKRYKRSVKGLEDHFLLKEWSEWKAYWMGFFLGDGNIGKEGSRLAVNLSVKDEDHLSLLKDSFGEKHVGWDYQENEKGNKWVCLAVYSGALLQHLQSLGLKPNKSVLGCPELVRGIPNEWWNHFLRGWIDADGSVGKSGVRLYGHPLDIAEMRKRELKWEDIKMEEGSLRGVSVSENEKFGVRDRLLRGATVFLARKWNIEFNKSNDDWREFIRNRKRDWHGCFV